MTNTNCTRNKERDKYNYQGRVITLDSLMKCIAD